MEKAIKHRDGTLQKIYYFLSSESKYYANDKVGYVYCSPDDPKARVTVEIRHDGTWATADWIEVKPEYIVDI